MPTQPSLDYFDVCPPYKGGHTTIYGGYVWELVPHHPLANRWGFVAQHRIVAEDLLGRPLVQSSDPEVRECVHHKDENRLNNAPENLEVLTFSAHRRYHTHKRNVEEFEPRRPSRDAVAEALASTPTIKDAAALVGVCHQTLRKHFPDLVSPYARRKPTNPLVLSGEQVALLRQVAADSRIGEREAEKILGMSGRTLRKCCALHGIPWVKKSRKGAIQKRSRACG